VPCVQIGVPRAQDFLTAVLPHGVDGLAEYRRMALEGPETATISQMPSFLAMPHNLLSDARSPVLEGCEPLNRMRHPPRSNLRGTAFFDLGVFQMSWSRSGDRPQRAKKSALAGLLTVPAMGSQLK